VGEPSGGGTPFRAAFTHVFHLGDGRIAELTQVTDSSTWVAALPAHAREG